MRQLKTISLSAAMMGAIIIGCGGDTSAKPTGTSKPAGTTDKTSSTDVNKSQVTPKTGGEVAKTTKDDHDHSGWWCTEHGIPEEECSMCSDKVAKEMKAKGDWCEKHERAMSQCFICKPDRREFYAAKHRAKLGKDPPPTEDQEKKDEKKGG